MNTDSYAELGFQNGVESFNTEVQNDVVVEMKRKLVLHPGGKVPDNDWLSPMKTGTIFLVRPKRYPNSDLADFTKAFQKGSAVLIRSEDQNDKVHYVWHDVERFVQSYELYAILKEPDEEQEGDNNDG